MKVQIKIIFISSYNDQELPAGSKFLCVGSDPQAAIDQLAKHNPQYITSGQLYFFEPRNPEEDMRIYWHHEPAIF